MLLSTQQIRHHLDTALEGDALRVSAITAREGKVGCVITVDPSEKAFGLALKARCEAVLRELPGVQEVTILVTAHHEQPLPPSPQSGYTQPRARAQWNITPIPGVRHVIAVASGKGGVGKSTTTVQLAHALRTSGMHVGILDADIYGPSIPHMLGLPNLQPEIRDGKMQPPRAHDIAIMSMGLITGEDAAILRGPMISKSLQQMLRLTDWGSLDVLLVDMPPGTGDIHLSMAQQVPLSGAIIVTTPQKVARLDATKSAQMFVKLNVPLLGVIENMTGPIFGEGGGNILAQEFGIPLLASIPLDAGLREASEQATLPDHSLRDRYLGACQHLRERL